MILSKLKDDIKADEGLVLHAYQDHLGYWTIGYGRLIDERCGGGITEEEAEYLLTNDILRKVDALAERTKLTTFPTAVQHALINMAFQLGVNGLLQFKKMWAHLDNHDYAAAADEALDSRWAKQTPSRAKRVTDMMRSEA